MVDGVDADDDYHNDDDEDSSRDVGARVDNDGVRAGGRGR